MIPIIISKSKFSGVSKKTGKSMNSVIYTLLCTDRYSNFNIRSVFVPVDSDPDLCLGDRVILDSLSGSLILHPSAPSAVDFIDLLYSL